MLLTKEVEILLHSKNIQYYENLGYEIPRYKNRNGMVVRKGTKIIVKVEDLSMGSHAEVEVLCDQCNKTKVIKEYKTYLKDHNNNKNNIDICNECRLKNMPNNLLRIYGVNSPSKLNWVKEKIRQTTMNNFGVQYPLQSPDILNKLQQTNLNKYGCICSAQAPEIKEKIIQINMERYGAKSAFENLEIKLKIRRTIFKKYGAFNITQSDFYKANYSGENSSNWKGGITPENKKIRESEEYKQWRISVFKRDNYTCQICGKSGIKLNAHHLENFADNPELRLDVNNGVTLCLEHHDSRIQGSFHNVYGTHSNTKKQFEEYEQQYLKDKNNICHINKKEVINS